MGSDASEMDENDSSWTCTPPTSSQSWNGNGKNLILITHYSIITAVTNAVPSSGEIVIADKNFKVLGTILTD